MENLKAISIAQPWAWAIAEGHKKVENRSQRYKYRGRLLIHASRTYWEIEKLPNGVKVPPLDSLDYGKVIGFCDLVDCVEMGERFRDDPFAQGPYCLLLQNFRKITPVDYRGQLGIYSVTQEPEVSEIMLEIKKSIDSG